MPGAYSRTDSSQHGFGQEGHAPSGDPVLQSQHLPNPFRCAFQKALACLEIALSTMDPRSWPVDDRKQ
ncbi:hypothetical protein BG004_000964 [Podila humilis]|nr:hypothetical protein BG004_000964 [Podila humilis]